MCASHASIHAKQRLFEFNGIHWAINHVPIVYYFIHTHGMVEHTELHIYLLGSF